MIDWVQVLTNALWISGAALALATVSYASWQASLRYIHLRAVLRQTTCGLSLRAAAMLFCLGLGLTASNLIETILWLVLAVISVIAFISLWRSKRTLSQS